MLQERNKLYSIKVLALLKHDLVIHNTGRIRSSCCGVLRNLCLFLRKMGFYISTTRKKCGKIFYLIHVNLNLFCGNISEIKTGILDKSARGRF